MSKGQIREQGYTITQSNNTLTVSSHCQYAGDVSVHLINLNIELISVIKQSQDTTSYIRYDLKNSSVPYVENTQIILSVKALTSET